VPVARCDFSARELADLLQNSDPLGFEAGDANLYRYVGNGPTDATDPTGLQEKLKFFPNQIDKDKDSNTESKKQLDKDKKLPTLIFPIPDRKALAAKLGAGVLKKGPLYKYVVLQNGDIVVINTSEKKDGGEPHLTHIMGTDPVGKPVRAAGHFRFTGKDKVTIDVFSTHYTKDLSKADKEVAINQAQRAWRKLYPKLKVDYKDDAK